MALTKADEEFIKRLNEVIELNYGNPEFSMDDMADKLNMSRSELLSENKGKLGIRARMSFYAWKCLKKAAQLLKRGRKPCE